MKLKITNPTSSLNKAKYELDSLIKNTSSSKLLTWNFILLIIIWILFGIASHFLPPQIPLYYSLPWGQDQIVPKSYLLLLPVASTILSLINLRLASITFIKESLLAMIILWMQIIYNFLVLTALIKTILLLL